MFKSNYCEIICMGKNQIKFIVIVFEKHIFVFTHFTKHNFENFQNLKSTNVSETTTQNYSSTSPTCIQKIIFQRKNFVLINHCDQLVCKEKFCDDHKRILSSLMLLPYTTSNFSKNIFVSSQELNFGVKNHVVIVNYFKNNFVEKLIQEIYQKNTNTITCKLKLKTCCKINIKNFGNNHFVFVTFIIMDIQNIQNQKILIKDFENCFGFEMLDMKINSISYRTSNDCIFVKPLLTDCCGVIFSFLFISSKSLCCVDAITQLHMLNKIKNIFYLQFFDGTVEEFYFTNEQYCPFDLCFFEIENIFFIFVINNILPKYFEKYFQQSKNYCALDVVLLDNTTTNISYPHASLVVLLDNTTTNISYAPNLQTLNTPSGIVSISLQLPIPSNCLSATANTTLNQYNPCQHSANLSDSAVSDDKPLK